MRIRHQFINPFEYSRADWVMLKNEEKISIKDMDGSLIIKILYKVIPSNFHQWQAANALLKDREVIWNMILAKP